MDYDIFVILSVGFTLFCAGGLINEIIKDFQPWNRSKKQETRTNRVPYSKLIKQIVTWSGPILLDEGIKRYPNVKVSYRKCKGADGYYSPKYKTVEVLVNHSVDVNRIVFVTLHEVGHYIQHQTDPDFKHYDVYERRFGYENNKFEIEANKFASDYQKSCLDHLKEIGFI